MKRLKINLVYKVFILAFVMLVSTLQLSNCIVRAEESHDSQYKRYFVDDAYLFDYDDAQALEKRLSEVSGKYECDVVIYTSNEDIAGRDSINVADDFFDYNGYGEGPKRDGIVFYINTYSRDWSFSTRGYGITAFTDAGLEYLEKQIIEDLRDEDFESAFNKFADCSDDFIGQAKNGKPYDRGNLPKDPSDLLVYLLISLGVGLVIAIVYVIFLSMQLKSVAPKNSAADYVKSGSVHVHDGGHIYLYSRVTKTKKESNNGSGGGSSTHRSSSGATHGGRSGKF